jgi:TonB-linked SusC/RagA family outer membrane protein
MISLPKQLLNLFKKNMKKILLACFSFGFALSLWAQDRAVTGKVTSTEDGSPLPGVNVVLKGTTIGTVTGADGTYQLSVPDDGTLQFSFIGYHTQEVQYGKRSVVDAQLETDVTQLSEVVVTGQGIEVKKAAVGYAVTSVDGQILQQRPDADVGRLLTGKMPGVNITANNGVAGSGTNIIIRGYTTITGDKQPLWIVDGVPINSGTNSTDGTTQGFLYGNQAQSSRFLDIDPNNIANVEVLKGLAASVLYGQQGRNGVIMITTKNAKKIKAQAAEVTVNQSNFVTEIASLPTLQTSYGNGFQNNFGFFFSNWGPSFASRDSIPNPYGKFADPTLQAQFPQYVGKNMKYQAFDNNKFFKQGASSQTSINLNGSTDNMSYNATVGLYDETGFIPNNELKKINFGFGVNSNITSKLHFSGSINFASTDMKTPPITAGNGSGSASSNVSIFGDIFYTPRSVDLMGMPFESPLDHRSVYYRSGNDIQNPRWTAQYTSQTDNVKRLYGRTQLTYDLAKDLNVSYRVGLDTYTEDQAYLVNKGGPVDLIGRYRTTTGISTLWNHDIIFNYKHQFGQDISLNATLGGNIRQDLYSQDGQESSGQVIFGFANHANFTSHSPTNTFTGQKLQYQRTTYYEGIYASAILGYKDYLYLNLQGRNDWVSTLESQYNHLFYPSASVSFVPTQAFPSLASTAMSNLKFRVGYGTSANFPGPYNTRSFLAQDTRAFLDPRNGNAPVVSNTVSARLGNPNLQAETQAEIEVGVEGKFLNDRISIDFSAYNRTTNKLILDTPLDPSTGYTITSINAGQMTSKGLELQVNGTAVRKTDFTWDVTLNWNAWRSEVNSLNNNLKQVLVPGGGYSNLGNFAIPGQPFGVIMGTYVPRTNGQRTVTPSGDYQTSQDIGIIGNPIPLWNSSIINTFNYKGIRFMFQWDYRQGGAIYSTTAATMLGRGITKDADFDHTRSFILPGVQADGTKNTVQTTASDYYFNNIGFGPSELQIYDGTTIRLSQVALGYSLPIATLKSTPFKEVTITFTGQNLWFNAVNMPKYVHFDTNTQGLGVGNGQGMDFLTGPSARKYGVNLKVRF